MQELKHVLLITYYWPPAGGPGVHRWLRLSKYFYENGFQLYVYCPKDAAWPIIDNNLCKQVDSHIIEIRNTIFEPHKYLGKKNNPNVGGGLTQDKRSSFLQKLIIWTRGNLFIPDARVFWIKPSVKFLSQYLRQHPEIKTIISTGPPHSLHVIALHLKKLFPIKWIADFRDPWTQIDFYEELKTGKRADLKQKKLEKECLQKADEIITVSKFCGEGLQNIVPRTIHIITNAYPFPEKTERNKAFTGFSLAHFGSISNSRNPELLWEVLGELVNENEDFKKELQIVLAGAVDFSVFSSIEKNGLKPFLFHFSMLSHEESIKKQKESALLLLLANKTGNTKGILTGKVFEYLAAYRPILAFGENGGDLQELIENTQAGSFFTYQEKSALKNTLKEYYQLYKENNLEVNSVNLSLYDSKEQVKKIFQLL
ncbi:MAG: glycosyl transferase family 1 [Flavobacteriia bacterium]|nr:glycosyl transferase family 1 [Flavobacteriia bacterium]